MKKFMALFCAAVMLLSLSACGNGTGSAESSAQREDTQTADSSTQQEDAQAAESSAQQEEGQADDSAQQDGSQDEQAAGGDTAAAGNVLVAYFSYTGNTEAVAQQIADYTGGTLAQIERAVPYEDVQTEGEEELESDARPEIIFPLDSIDEYDTIFVGYPIWWDEAPMVIATFLESYDFSGKTIVPFCTSASDSIDNSLHIFGELAPDAEIVEGLTANDEEEIEPWLAGLGF